MLKLFVIMSLVILISGSIVYYKLKVSKIRNKN